MKSAKPCRRRRAGTAACRPSRLDLPVPPRFAPFRSHAMLDVLPFARAGRGRRLPRRAAGPRRRHDDGAAADAPSSPAQGYPIEHVVHMAIGTATATIMFTSISSVREHHRHGAVLWSVVAGLAPAVVAGSLVGPQIVGGLSTPVLAAFFGTFVAAAATKQPARSQPPKPTRELPGRGGLFARRQRHRARFEHGRRRRCVPDGAVHDGMQRQAPQRGCDLRGASVSPSRSPARSDSSSPDMRRRDCRRTRSATSTCRRFSRSSLASVIVGADGRARCAPLAGRSAAAIVRVRCSTCSPRTCSGKRPRLRSVSGSRLRPSRSRRSRRACRRRSRAPRNT